MQRRVDTARELDADTSLVTCLTPQKLGFPRCGGLQTSSGSVVARGLQVMALLSEEAMAWPPHDVEGTFAKERGGLCGPQAMGRTCTQSRSQVAIERGEQLLRRDVELIIGVALLGARGTRINLLTSSWC